MEDFRITEKDGLRLILPSHTVAVSNAAWTKDNLWLRSRVECPKTGDTVSQGFGKFFNLGMGPEALNVDASSILTHIKDDKEVIATLKYDGSCLIRSVYKGKVMFRTRGSLSYEFHDKAAEELEGFLSRYPNLNDPTFYPDRSLFFEWVSPDAQIVVKYDKPELHLIGGVEHGHRHISHLRYLDIVDLEIVAKRLSVPMMEYHKLDSVQKWHHLYQHIQDHREIEGYVIRLDNQQTLVKIKSQSYLTKHGLKSNLSFKSMIEFWLQHDRLDHDGILMQLEHMYDEEVVAWALPFVIELSVAIDGWKLALAEVRRKVNGMTHWPRKDFAMEMQTVYKSDRTMFSIAMQLFQDKPIEDRMIRNFMSRYMTKEESTCQ